MYTAPEIRYKKDSDEFKIAKRFYEMIGLGVNHCESEHNRCEENQRFVRGHQWAEGDLLRQKDRERPALPMNSLIKLLNAVSNREIMDRIVPKVFARNEDGHGIAEALDAANQWQRSLAESEHEESMAFRWTCASGYGVLHKWWDPVALDGDGMIRDEEIPIWYMLWDPVSRKQNLVDRKWHICGKFVDFEEAKEVFGDVSKQAKKAFRDMNKIRFGQDTGGDTSNDAQMGGAGTWGQILGNKWLSMSGKEIFIIEGEWKEIDSFWRVGVPVKMSQYVSLYSDPNSQADGGVDPSTGQPIMISGADFMQMEPTAQRELMQQMLSVTEVQKFQERSEWEPIAEQYEAITGMEFVDFKKEKREIIKYALMTDGIILDHGQRSTGFSYEFLTGFPFETRETIQFFGMIDVAKGPQDMKNVFYSHLLSIFMTSPKQHLLIEEGAVSDANKFMDDYAKVTGVSFVQDGFFSKDRPRFEKMDPPHFPPMIRELIDLAENAVQDIFGLSSIESNSQGDLRRVSGNVADIARQSTNTLLAILFDSLRRGRKRIGLLNVKSIMAFYDPPEIAQILGSEQQDYVQQINQLTSIDTWPKNVRFDIKIDESPASITEQLKTLDYLTRTGAIVDWMNTEKIPFDEGLDLFVTIPQSKRDKIKKARAQQAQHQAEIDALNAAIQTMTLKEEMFKKFVATTVEGGNEAVAQFDSIQAFAQNFAAEINLVQEQAQNQGA